jgi:hypothetical protein
MHEGPTMREDKVRQALVELLYRNSYGVVISNIVISLAAVYVLRSDLSSGWLAGWLGALYLLTATRLLASRCFFRRNAVRGSNIQWAWLAAAFSWISGLLWGTLGWAGFLPESPVVLSFTVIVLTGLVCGTVPSLSAFPPALVGSILLTVLPIAVRCILINSDISGPFLFLLASLVAHQFLLLPHHLPHAARDHQPAYWKMKGLVEHLQEERDRAQSPQTARKRASWQPPVTICASPFMR